MDEKERSQDEENRQMITEIREWLVRIDTNQQHQTKLLETLTTQADNAFEKADHAESKAEEALKRSIRIESDFNEYEKEQVAGRRWTIGIAVSLFVALLPIFTNFYL
jgi:hypothetical protein